MASKDSVTVETKYIIDELNSLLNKNYNMLSLDSMSRIETLQLICNVLQRLEVLDNVSVFLFFNTPFVINFLLNILGNCSH